MFDVGAPSTTNWSTTSHHNALCPMLELGWRGSLATADIEQFWETESFNNVVEVGRRYNRETTEENGATFEKNTACRYDWHRKPP
ncbi:hypothetical protein E3N88_24405 [Mikania micrantha]|uniref:Uncharacterized protein n=1 Tax=Mikania micrantha TaxID=192012 RepID=A0A5N6N2C7_9ASTR|nr:hypothetical protein E3N88_24405 [Mikania micrantha]